jgi:hypothetical protein
LIVAGTERERCVNQITVGIVDLKAVETSVEGRSDALRAVIGVSQLGGDEQILSLNRSGVEHLAYRVTHRRLIAVSFCAIEMSKPDSQCSFGGLLGFGKIRNERAKPDSGHRALSMGELNPRIAKCIGCCHRIIDNRLVARSSG